METLQAGTVESIAFSEEGPLDGFTNMLRDARLLERAESGEASCRVYKWDGPWVSLGKQQVAERDLLTPIRVPWVSRPTGGRAVLHGHDITVGFAAPLELIEPFGGEGPHPLSRSVRTVYRFVTAPLIAALNRCGMDVVLGERAVITTGEHRSSDCFAHVSANDIVCRMSGQKACGCALRLTAHAVLVQSSIPFGLPLVDPKAIFGVAQVASPVEWNPAEFAATLKKTIIWRAF